MKVGHDIVAFIKYQSIESQLITGADTWL